MNLLISIVLHVVLLVIGVEADTSELDYPPPDYTSLKPSLAVVIGILSVMFVLTFLLLVYAKFCHRPARPAELDRGQNRGAAVGSSGRFSGIDKTVIESLPFFRFSALQGSRDGLECAVCLSKFEDIEVLRLLPKCKHAFHIDCVDHWLERHSSCPLCRHRVGAEDLKLVASSNSLRFLNQPADQLGQDSNSSGVELFVQREESRRRGSSRFSIGGSFRRVEGRGDQDGGGEEDEGSTLIRNESEPPERESGGLHKHNHRILVPEFALKSRWSNVSSSDLIMLSSEMLLDASSARFSPKTEQPLAKKAGESEEIMRIKEEMVIKKSFESKVGPISTADYPASVSGSKSMVNSSGEQRSVSEITAFSRYRNSVAKTGPAEPGSLSEEGVREERIRRVWLPIARRTVQWFANREQRSELPQNLQRQCLDV